MIRTSSFISKKFILISFVLLNILIISQAFGQIIDIDKEELAKLLGRLWVSDLSVDDTGNIGFTIFCNIDGKTKISYVFRKHSENVQSNSPIR